MEDLLRRIRSGTTTVEDAEAVADLRRCHDEHYRDVVQLMKENERLREIIEGYWGAGYIDGNADG